MKKNLMFAIILVSLLAVDLSCVAMQARQTNPNPGVINSKGDLWGANEGDKIVFNWVDQDGATDYIIYRSLSANGPWEEIDRLEDIAARTGGSKVDVTPDASLMDLCYMVEAIDGLGFVIRTYQPICVPKFVAPLAPAAGPVGTIPGLCITEPEFILTDFNAVTLDQIRQFLAGPQGGGFLSQPFLDVDGVTMVDAAQEIFNAAQNNKIHPRVLLTTLEKESSSVHEIRTRPSNDALRKLAGWDPAHLIISKAQKSAREQIQDMAAQFARDYYTRLSQCQNTPRGWDVDVGRSRCISDLNEIKLGEQSFLHDSLLL